MYSSQISSFFSAPFVTHPLLSTIDFFIFSQFKKSLFFSNVEVAEIFVILAPDLQLIATNANYIIIINNKNNSGNKRMVIISVFIEAFCELIF